MSQPVGPCPAAWPSRWRRLGWAITRSGKARHRNLSDDCVVGGHEDFGRRSELEEALDLRVT